MSLRLLSALFALASTASCLGPTPDPTPTPSDPPVTTTAPPAPTTTPGPLTTQTRFPALSKVAAVGQWNFALDKDLGAFQALYPDEVFSRFAAEGFTAVRLAIDPEMLADASGTLYQDRFAEIVTAISRIEAAGLGVVFDMHVWKQGEWMQQENIDRLARMWEQMGAALSGFDPSLTFLELYNEPAWWSEPELWAGVETQLYVAARGAAPNLPIVLTGPKSGGIEGLPESPVIEDSNVVYTIHMYNPLPFTHQGSPWTDDVAYGTADRLPFPATPEACADAIGRQPTPEATQLATDYCAGGYDEAWVRNEFATAAAWAEAHGVQLFLGEFGVSPSATMEDGTRWLRAVRTAAEDFGMGWSIWEADGPMGLRNSGWYTTIADEPVPEVLAALGLNNA